MSDAVVPTEKVEAWIVHGDRRVKVSARTEAALEACREDLRAFRLREFQLVNTDDGADRYRLRD